MSASLLYAFSLGLVAALNPCGFPLLPAYLTGFVDGGAGGTWTARTGRALAAGAAVTLGFLAVFLPLGALVAGGVHVVLGWVPWAMIPFGLLLVAVGALTAAGRPLKVTVPVVPVGRARGRWSQMVLFGVAYAVASLSCALPVFVAGVTGTVAQRGVAQGVADFLAYALGMGLLLAVAALVVAHLGAPTLRRVRRLGPLLQRLVGVVLVAVGAYLVYYWASFEADGRTVPGLVRAVERVQSTLVAWLSGAVRPVGAGLVVLVALALLALLVRGGSARQTEPAIPVREEVAVGDRGQHPAGVVEAVGHGGEDPQ
ncbi:cytochrome c biogenesis CcdA family protein [Aciditerrimonas ferrireducens]|jgi:cytochrome c biogenesis protein CcdA|uniref:Cytochrome c biogenesis CcdA family protein n=1 Tax=Aciditerrimonas ferrireducens TaxID=667306 RepID=A0ABV6BZS7_9ACTN